MSDVLSITPRNLGALALDGYCPRCLWYLLQLRFHPPFCHFGAATFNDAQRSQEAVIGYFLEEEGCLPKEFAPFGDCVARADFPRHWSKLRTTHKSGVVLYGAPDEIYTRKDDPLAVCDLKTAHFRGDADPFHPQYQIQVIGYGAIAEGLKLGTVTLGGLLYWEAQTESVIHACNLSIFAVRAVSRVPRQLPVLAAGRAAAIISLEDICPSETPVREYCRAGGGTVRARTQAYCDSSPVNRHSSS